MSSDSDSEYKTPSDHNITDTEESDVKTSKRKRKEKSKRIEAKKKGKQVAGNSNSEVQLIEDVDCFETRCRPYHLYTLIHQFSQDQMKSVKEIGFDGLLHLKVTNTVTKMLSWLVNRFDQSSRYFELSPGVGFVLTPYDVHDVFGLPFNAGNNIVECRMGVKDDPDFNFKRELRDIFNVDKDIPLQMVEKKILELKEGGETFKKLFVLHAFSSFLAPHRKRFIDMRLAKVVSNVDQIRTYDWCSYVIDRFCEADKAYKQGNLQFHCGCLILLELVYFHRLRFRDVGEPTTLPLIQHWTDEKIKIRINGEKEAKRFGLGILDTVTYPISRKLKFVDGFAVNNESEKVLDRDLFANKDFLKFADKLCQLYWKDKTGSGNFDPNYEARLANLTARANEVIGDVLIDINETENAPNVPSNPPPSEPPLSPPAEASTVPLSPSPVVQFEEGERVVDEEYRVLDDGKSLISSILTNGTAGCSLPLGDRGVEVLFVSHFMKHFKKEMRNLHKLQQEVVDYVLVEDDLCCDDDELVVTFGPNHSISRYAIKNLGMLQKNQVVPPIVIDCWALILNNNELSKFNKPQKFWFGASQSSEIVRLLELDNEPNTQDNDSVQSIWLEWIKDVSFENIELVFIPILYNGHYVLYVVDFKNMQIKFLDNRTYESTELKTIRKLTHIMIDQLDYALENQRLSLTEAIVKLKFKLIPPYWKSSKDVDHESAIYLMMTMLLFDEDKYPKCVELIKARQRKYLQAEICVTLVLSDMNARRSEIVDRCKAYNTNREEKEHIVAQRRKQRLAEEKKFNAVKEHVLEKHQKKTNMEQQPRRNEKRNVQKKHCCSGK